MTVIDLHGVKHEHVECIIHSACVEHPVPFIVITGNSPQMKRIVAAVARTFGLSVRDSIDNPGRVVVDEIDQVG